MLTREWDLTCPAGISLVDHLKDLVFVVMGVWRSAGAKGVIITSPEISALLEASHSFRPDPSAKPMMRGEPARVGHLFGIPLWVRGLQPKTMIYFVEEPDGPVDASIKVVGGWMPRRSILDDLAEASLCD